MSEARDLAIKLFGKTIALPATVEGVHDKFQDHPNKEETTKDSKNREQESPKSEDKKEQDDDDEATESGKNSNPEEEQEQEQNESSNSQDKLTLKKPDKLLPCPRCNSLDTKFCYFNNYNVNQPRHFCKNCQRYWTAGGTMRNVPVGAGRRKNKSSIPSHYRHLTVSDPNNNPNGTVLSFGSDTPLYNGIHHREEQQMEEQSCANSNSIEEGIGNCHGFVSPWPFPYMPPPNMSASAFQMPFYPTPAPYWGCNPWSMPWLPIPTATLTLGKHTREEDIDVTNNVSETREETTNRLWFPKTLRIADPEEASKSSIWTTMGFNSDKADSTGTGRGFFKSFQKKKGEVRAHLTEASQALHANPAALSRAISFQESS